MIEYIAQVIIWTLILYIGYEIIRILIWRFVISQNKIKDIYSKTKSEGKNVQ